MKRKYANKGAVGTPFAGNGKPIQRKASSNINRYNNVRGCPRGKPAERTGGHFAFEDSFPEYDHIRTESEPYPSLRKLRSTFTFVQPKLRIKRTKEERNRSLQTNWESAGEQLEERRLMYLGKKAEHRDILGTAESTLALEIHDRFQLACKMCPKCGGVSCYQKPSSSSVLVVDILAHAHVDWPSIVCRNCAHSWLPNPADVGTFPATPVRPETIYTDRLLQLITNIKFEGHISMHALSHAFHDFHLQQHAGKVEKYTSLWENVGDAWERWRVIEKRVLSLCRLGVEHIEEGWKECAACFKVTRCFFWVGKIDATPQLAYPGWVVNRAMTQV